MTEEMTAAEMKRAEALAAQIQATALAVLRPMVLTMQREEWTADVCALMWRAIASAALENARRLDARS